MNNYFKQRKILWFPQVVLVCVLGIAYCLTIAHGLSWVNNGADGGDLITAAATGGVAHPTGYPTYLLVAHFFQLIPVGTLAFRTNLLSMVFAILSSLLVYQTFVDLVGINSKNCLAGIIASLTFGLSPLTWSQAVITEVYTLQAFFEILILFLLFKRLKISIDHPVILDLIIGVIFGIALGNHLLTIFLLPLICINGIIVKPIKKEDHPLASGQWNIKWNILFSRLLGTFLGLLVYTSLYFRARSGAPVNWGNPVTMNNFLWLVTGKLYQSNLFAFSNGNFLIRLRVWGEVILRQGGVIGLIIGLMGILASRKVSFEFIWNSVYLVIVFLFFSFLYSTSDSFIYLIFAFLVFSLWIGLGVVQLIEIAGRAKPWMGTALGLLFLFLVLGYGVKTSGTVDASKNSSATTFGEQVMATAPEHAMIFTDGDKDSFTLWYYCYALKQRQDIAVIVTNLLPYDWYRSTLQNTYSTLIIPKTASGTWESTLISSNNNRPICETIVVEQGQMHCWEN